MGLGTLCNCQLNLNYKVEDLVINIFEVVGLDVGIRDM